MKQNIRQIAGIFYDTLSTAARLFPIIMVIYLYMLFRIRF